MKETALKYMRAPYHVIFIDDQKRLTLHGLKQYYAEVNEKQKFKYLYGILSKVDYNQCIIFTSKVDRAKYLNKMLKDVHISSLTIHADMNQKQRIVPSPRRTGRPVQHQGHCDHLREHRGRQKDSGGRAEAVRSQDRTTAPQNRRDDLRWIYQRLTNSPFGLN